MLSPSLNVHMLRHTSEQNVLSGHWCYMYSSFASVEKNEICFLMFKVRNVMLVEFAKDRFRRNMK